VPGYRRTIADLDCMKMVNVMKDGSYGAAVRVYDL
jgi:hypothetical protein